MIDRLEKSIIGTVLGYYLLQLAIFAVFAVFAPPADAAASESLLATHGIRFLVVTSVFHAVLLCMLLLFRRDFEIVPSGLKLDRVNLANIVTLFRLTSMPTLLFLVLAAKDYRIRFPLLGLVVLVFATDFADGLISRKSGQVTKMGKMLDSSSDYVLLIVLTIVFYYFSLVPPWFFLLVTTRLGLQVAFVFILIFVNKKIEPKTTFMGKLAVASIMVLYALEVLRLIFGIGRIEFVVVLELLTAAIVLASMFDKVIAFARELPKRSA